MKYVNRNLSIADDDLPVWSLHPIVVSQKLPFATSLARLAPIRTETGIPPRASWMISEIS